MNSKKKPKPRNDEIINYLFRPAKSIERKMLCEALNRLSVISDIKDYQYVGFGSVYFADFSLFHKNLGIHKLISIEGNEDMELRVRFNQPYKCIEVLPGWSYDRLPEVNWKSAKSILWLDYTDSLSSYMFKDIATFFRRAESGSMFIISINADLRDDEDDSGIIHEKIKRKINKDADVRKRIRDRDIKDQMQKRDYYSILRNIIHQEVLEIIENRNKLSEDRFTYKQLFNFLYRDGQVMLTIGGIFLLEKELSKLPQMNFESLDFVRMDNTYYEIQVPHLTNQEIHALNKYLPNFNTDEKEKEKALQELDGVVSNESIHKYAKIYRYFPIYTEINI